MKLYLNAPSPYARKVVAVAHELGVADKVDILTFDPWGDPQSGRVCGGVVELRLVKIYARRRALTTRRRAAARRDADIHSNDLQPTRAVAR